MSTVAFALYRRSLVLIHYNFYKSLKWQRYKFNKICFSITLCFAIILKIYFRLWHCRSSSFSVPLTSLIVSSPFKSSSSSQLEDVLGFWEQSRLLCCLIFVSASSFGYFGPLAHTKVRCPIGSLFFRWSMINSLVSIGSSSFSLRSSKSKAVDAVRFRLCADKYVDSVFWEKLSLDVLGVVSLFSRIESMANFIRICAHEDNILNFW